MFNSRLSFRIESQSPMPYTLIIEKFMAIQEQSFPTYYRCSYFSDPRFLVHFSFLFNQFVIKLSIAHNINSFPARQ